MKLPGWPVALLLLLGGCHFEQEFELFCRDTGYCRCDGADCCAEFGQACTTLGCCDGMACTNGLCEGTVQLSFTPPSLEFRTDDQGVTAPPATLRLSNTGQRRSFALNLGPQEPTGTDITIDLARCNRELGPGESCDIGVGFTPRSLGEQHVQITAASGQTGASAQVSGKAGNRLFIEYQGTWPGSVHSDPPGIDCPWKQCELYVSRGTSVQLADDGDAGVRGEVGPPCGRLPCTVVMDSDLSLTTQFVPFLTVGSTGLSGGTVHVNADQACGFGSICQYPLFGPTTVYVDGLGAAPWATGPCAGQEPTCLLNLIDPVTVDVDFLFLNGISLTGPLRPIDVGPDGAEADIRCNGKIAWIFTSTRDPRTRLAASRGWNNGNYDQPFLDRLTDAVEGRVQSALPYTGTQIISGLKPGGVLPAPSDVCNDFRSSTGSMVAGSGWLGGIAWYFDPAAPRLNCTDPAYVLCVDPGPQVRVLQPFGTQRLAFLSAPWIPSGGTSAADARCQAEAAASGFTGTYRALVAPTGGMASDRFVGPSGRSWTTVTGIAVRDRGYPPITVPQLPYLNIALDGGVILSDGDAGTGSLVWSDEPSTDDLDTCASWTGGAGRTGRVRRPESQGSGQPFAPGRVSCTTAQRLVCLQDQ